VHLQYNNGNNNKKNHWVSTQLDHFAKYIGKMVAYNDCLAPKDLLLYYTQFVDVLTSLF
jgi:hypothetical protein